MWAAGGKSWPKCTKASNYPRSFGPRTRRIGVTNQYLPLGRLAFRNKEENYCFNSEVSVNLISIGSGLFLCSSVFPKVLIKRKRKHFQRSDHVTNLATCTTTFKKPDRVFSEFWYISLCVGLELIVTADTCVCWRCVDICVFSVCLHNFKQRDIHHVSVNCWWCRLTLW
jgi:hypothetical protein